jgi:hypothetical protein
MGQRYALVARADGLLLSGEILDPAGDVIARSIAPDDRGSLLAFTDSSAAVQMKLREHTGRSGKLYSLRLAAVV